MHVRKPAAGSDSIARLLEEFPQCYRSRLSLHDHHELAENCGVGGVHLNSRNPSAPDGFGGLVSRSCHSMEELSEYGSVCDYMFLSPIFDSISKSGYVSRFSLEEIRRRIVAGSDVATARMDVMSSDGNCRPVDWERVFALGGVWLLSSAVSGSRSDWTITVLHCPNGSGT